MPTNFDELKGAISESEAYDQIRSDETAFSDETFGDAEALGIVLQDASTAIAYFNSKGLLPAGIDNADDLIRAYVKPRVWPDGKPRSNLPMYVVLEAVEKLIPILHMSLFGSGKKRPFGLEPRGQTKPAAARAQASLLHWAMKQAGTKEEMRRMIKTCLTYGFTVGSWGWEDCEHKEKVYERQPDGTVKGTLKVVTIAQPTFECHDLKNILVDPACKRQDIQKGARYVIKQKMVTSNELDDLRDDDTYKNIPSRSDLRDILANKAEPTQDTLGAIKHATWREFQSELDSKSTSVDPLQQPLELLEYWTNDRVITVLQRRIVIRNEENEFGKLPFVSAAFVDVLGSAWGFGVARLLSGEQRLQQGVVNNWIDSLALVLNPSFQLLKGVGPGSQNIGVAPGKVITESGELKPLVTPDVTGPAMTAVTTSEERGANRVGSNGGSSMPNQAMRTGTGVQAFSADVTQRLQYFLEIFIDCVYIPILENFLVLLSDHLTPEQVNMILSEEEGKAYQGEDILEVYNARCSVEVLAGTNLTAKFAASQMAPMIIQLVSASPVQDSMSVQAVKFNYEEFITQTLDLMGYDIGGLIIPMTDDDKQRQQQQNAAAAKGMADSQLQQQKQQDNLESIDAKGTAQAGVAVVRSILKHHEDAAQGMMDQLQPGAASQ